MSFPCPVSPDGGSFSVRALHYKTTDREANPVGDYATRRLLNALAICSSYPLACDNAVRAGTVRCTEPCWEVLSASIAMVALVAGITRMKSRSPGMSLRPTV